ncbi:MAG TPA: multicopper oxidase domain-containing protein, partial [Gemmatimonadaceae bacterium]|nr:multicopper oxidase domain-containing protein [Gemmatimonadaceae bacterium]
MLARNILITAIAPLALGFGHRNYRDAVPPLAQINDNRIAAGVMKDSTLTVHLYVGMARWYPEAADGPYADVAAVGEEGKPLQIPGPLIRVPAGTTIDATIRNALSDSTIYIRGVLTNSAKPMDSLPILPGESRTLRYKANTAGDFWYVATPGLVDWDKRERETAAGAIIVDAPGAHKPDRVFVINIWGESDQKDTSIYNNALAINGKSWPYTERISTNVGDSLRWHVVNATTRNHPMHLHGFYFRVAGRNGITFAPEKQPLEVTDDMNAFSAIVMDWAADRPGNWLFHCHIGFHVLPGDAQLSGHMKHGSHDMEAERHMAGLILG